MNSTTKYLSAVGVAILALFTSSCGLLAPRTSGDSTSEVAAVSKKELILVGTFTGGGSEGVYSFTYQPSEQALRHTGTFVTPNPSYMALDRAKRVVYIANEQTRAEEAMATSAAIDGRSGRLSALNSSYTLGASPTYITTDGKDKVVTANYGSGSITLFNVDSRGLLGQPDWHIVMSNPEESHPHAVVLTPDKKELFVPDKGHDKVYHFLVSNTNPPLTIDGQTLNLPEGTGPRHIIFDKRGDHAYLIAERVPKLFVYRRSGGEMALEQTVELPLPAGTHGQHIALSADGRFLYTSHCDAVNVITVFSVDPSTGRLSVVGRQEVGDKPRQFAISPDGSLLAVACKDSNRVEFYRRNAQTGLLQSAKPLGITVKQPVFVLWERSY